MYSISVDVVVMRWYLFLGLLFRFLNGLNGIPLDGFDELDESSGLGCVTLADGPPFLGCFHILIPFTFANAATRCCQVAQIKLSKIS